MCVSGQNKIMKSNTTHFIMVEESAHMRLLVTADNLTGVKEVTINRSLMLQTSKRC